MPDLNLESNSGFLSNQGGEAHIRLGFHFRIYEGQSIGSPAPLRIDPQRAREWFPTYAFTFAGSC